MQKDYLHKRLPLGGVCFILPQLLPNRAEAMPNLFSRLFRSNGPTEAPHRGPWLDGQLEYLENEAAEASQGLRGTPLNTAGDLCHKAGDRARALRYYGRSIDAFLADDQPEAARGVARKIIRVHPEAVRTLCTLTWLDLGSSHQADALVHLQEYVAAAEKAGRQDLAREQIVQMAKTVAEGAFLEAAAQALDRLDGEADAVRVRAWALEEGGAKGSTADPVERLARCLNAAIGSNTQRNAEGAVA